VAKGGSNLAEAAGKKKVLIEAFEALKRKAGPCEVFGEPQEKKKGEHFFPDSRKKHRQRKHHPRAASMRRDFQGGRGISSGSVNGRKKKKHAGRCREAQIRKRRLSQ